MVLIKHKEITMKSLALVIFATLLTQTIFAGTEALLQCNSHSTPLFGLSAQIGFIAGHQEKHAVKHVFLAEDGSTDHVYLSDDPTFTQFDNYLNTNSFTSKFVTLQTELNYNGDVEFKIYYGNVQPVDGSKSAVVNWSNFSETVSENYSNEFVLSFQYGPEFKDNITLDCYLGAKFK